MSDVKAGHGVTGGDSMSEQSTRQELIGRDAHLEVLDRLVRHAEPSRLPLTWVVRGETGSGRTTLAQLIGRTLALAHGTGCGYLDVSEFDIGGPRSHLVIRCVLDQLGVQPQAIPAEIDAQWTLLRQRVAAAGLVLVCDNVPVHGEVWSALREGDFTLVVVPADGADIDGDAATVRSELAPFGAAEREQFVASRFARQELPENLRLLLTRRCGAQPASLRAGCALAAAALARGEPPFADPGPDLAPAQWLSEWFLRIFGTPTAALVADPRVRLLAAHDAAAMSGCSLRQAEAGLVELAEFGFLDASADGDYHVPNWTRMLAAPARMAGNERTGLARYTATTLAADAAIYPGRRKLDPVDSASHSMIEFADSDSAMRWLAMNHLDLLRMLDHARQQAQHTHVWQLAWGLTTYFAERGHWHDWLWTSECGVESARALGDLDAQRRLLRNLCRCQLRLGKHQDALQTGAAALALFVATDDWYGTAHTRLSLSYANERLERYQRAVAESDAALAIFREATDTDGCASALNTSARLSVLMGRPRAALRYAAEAIALFDAEQNRQGLVAAQHTCGRANADLGRHHVAITHYQQALAVIAGDDNKYYESIALRRIASSYRALGQLDASRTHLREALQLLQNIDHPEAEDVRLTIAESVAPQHHKAEGNDHERLSS